MSELDTSGDLFEDAAEDVAVLEVSDADDMFEVAELLEMELENDEDAADNNSDITAEANDLHFLREELGRINDAVHELGDSSEDEYDLEDSFINDDDDDVDEIVIELGRRSENNVRDAATRNGARRHENNPRQRPRRRSSAPPAGGRFFHFHGVNIQLEIADFFDHIFVHHGGDSSPEPVIDPEDVSSPSEDEMLDTNAVAGRRRLPRRRARQNASNAIHHLSMSGRRATRTNAAAAHNRAAAERSPSPVPGPSNRTPRRNVARRRPREPEVITLGLSPAPSPPVRRRRLDHAETVVLSDDDEADREVAVLTSEADKRRRQEEEDFNLALQLATANEVHDSSLIAEYNGIPKRVMTPPPSTSAAAASVASDVPGPSGVNSTNSQTAQGRETLTCVICYEDDPKMPVGCLHCRQLIGCK
ncbi:hypothetical protein AAVH_37849, partial [Aphelenchoides avenae]